MRFAENYIFGLTLESNKLKQPLALSYRFDCNRNISEKNVRFPASLRLENDNWFFNLYTKNIHSGKIITLCRIVVPSQHQQDPLQSCTAVEHLTPPLRNKRALACFSLAIDLGFVKYSPKRDHIQHYECLPSMN